MTAACRSATLTSYRAPPRLREGRPQPALDRMQHPVQHDARPAVKYVPAYAYHPRPAVS